MQGRSGHDCRVQSADIRIALYREYISESTWTEYTNTDV
jgi:hypothetical protein